MPLSEEEKRYLLKLARDSIASCLEGRRPYSEEADYPVLKERRGVFVTLKKGGKLRGCIGQLFPRDTLDKLIRDMAIASAFEDPRFPPLNQKELEEIKIEISLLSPLKPIKSIEEFEVGKHGIYMKKGFHSAVFLPQVAVEQGWNREQTLEHLSLKAGLPPHGWKKGAEFFVFTAEVFEEK